MAGFEFLGPREAPVSESDPATAKKGSMDFLFRPPSTVAPTPSEPKSLLRQAGDFITNDIPELAKSGLDTSQANIQRSITNTGLMDLSENERRNREISAAELARVSPETRQAMQDFKYSNDNGFENPSIRGIGGHVAQSILNVPSMAGIAGGIMQKVPHLGVKALGFGLSSAANALDIGGGAAHTVAEQGGDLAAQKQANLEGGALGAVTGLAEPLIISKVVGGEGGSLLRRVGSGAGGEALQEYPEEYGQAVVENRALGKQWDEGAHERGMLGAGIGAISGGVFGAAGAIANNASIKMPQAPADTRTPETDTITTDRLEENAPANMTDFKSKTPVAKASLVNDVLNESIDTKVDDTKVDGTLLNGGKPIIVPKNEDNSVNQQIPVGNASNTQEDKPFQITTPEHVASATDLVKQFDEKLANGSVFTTVPTALRAAAQNLGVYDKTHTPEQMFSAVKEKIAEFQTPATDNTANINAQLKVDTPNLVGSSGLALKPFEIEDSETNQNAGIADTILNEAIEVENPVDPNPLLKTPLAQQIVAPAPAPVVKSLLKEQTAPVVDESNDIISGDSRAVTYTGDSNQRPSDPAERTTEDILRGGRINPLEKPLVEGVVNPVVTPLVKGQPNRHTNETPIVKPTSQQAVPSKDNTLTREQKNSAAGLDSLSLNNTASPSFVLDKRGRWAQIDENGRWVPRPTKKAKKAERAKQVEQAKKDKQTELPTYEEVGDNILLRKQAGQTTRAVDMSLRKDNKEEEEVATQTEDEANRETSDEAGLDGENGVPYVPTGDVRSDSVYINNDGLGKESNDIESLTTTQTRDKLGNHHVIAHPKSVVDGDGKVKDIPIVRNGVAALHRALTNDSGNLKFPTLQADGTYKIDDQVYSVTRDQGNLKIESVSQADDTTHAVSIEKEDGIYGHGQYFIKLHKFNSESGESATRVRVMQAFKKGRKWANTFMKGKGVDRAKNASKLLHFEQPKVADATVEATTETGGLGKVKSIAEAIAKYYGLPEFTSIFIGDRTAPSGNKSRAWYTHDLVNGPSLGLSSEIVSALSSSDARLRASALETIHHELGHHAAVSLYDRASPEVKAAVEKDYAKFLEESKTRTPRETITARNTLIRGQNVRDKVRDSSLPPLTSEQSDYIADYAISFQEWLADEGAKYLLDPTSIDKLDPLTQGLIQKIAAYLQELIGKFSKEYAVGGEGIKAFYKELEDRRVLARIKELSKTKDLTKAPSSLIAVINYIVNNSSAKAYSFKENNKTISVLERLSDKGKLVTLTPSALRYVGSIINNTDNKSLENQLANFNTGLSAAIARFGELSFDKGMTLDKIVIADKNKFGEHSLMTHGQATKDIRGDLNTTSKASNVVKAARKILDALWGPANAASEAGKAIEDTLAPLKATQKTVSEAKEAIAAYEKSLLRVNKDELTAQAEIKAKTLITVVNKLYAKARLTGDKTEIGKAELDILQRLSDNLDNRDTSPHKVIEYLYNIINKNSKIAQNYTGTDEAPETLAGESKVDNAATQHYDASQEDVAKGNFNTDPRTAPTLGVAGKVLPLSRQPTPITTSLLRGSSIGQNPGTMEVSSQGEVKLPNRLSKTMSVDSEGNVGDKANIGVTSIGLSSKPNTNTTKQDTITQGNRSVTNLATHINAKATKFFDGLLKKLRIPQTFTLLDAHGLEKAKIPDAVRAQIALDPYSSAFIAFDTANNMLGHFIYIATKNPDGTNRSRAQQTFDMAHEFGHFVQRNVLDHIVNAAGASGDSRATDLLGSLLGIEAQDGIDPVTRYQGMNDTDRDIVDEMFANNLADALVREKGALEVDGTTFTDVMGADASTFFSKLAKLMLNAYRKVVNSSHKSTFASVDSFILAMTGRTEKVEYAPYDYYALVESGGRSLLMRPTKKARTQYNKLQLASMLDKITKLSKDVQGGLTHLLGVGDELNRMAQDPVLTGSTTLKASSTAKWIMRQFLSKTGDLGRKYHELDFLGLRHAYQGELNDAIEAVLPFIPKPHTGLFGMTDAPQGQLMLAALHDYLMQEGPLSSIPANLNFTVEQVQGGVGGEKGAKNVTLNVRDTIKKLRAFDRKLHLFTIGEGGKQSYKHNHWAKLISRMSAMKNEEAIRAALMAPTSALVWETTVDPITGKISSKQVMHEEEGWTLQQAHFFIQGLITGEFFDPSPFLSEDQKLKSKADDAMWATIPGATNNANKSRTISQVRWLALKDFTEADPGTMMATRSTAASKTAALENRFGAWVIPVAGHKIPTLMSREAYWGTAAGKYRDGWYPKQKALLHDFIVDHMGRPDLTTQAIEDWQLNEVIKLGKKVTSSQLQRIESKAKYLYVQRRDVVKEALDPKNKDAITEAAKEENAKFLAQKAEHRFDQTARLTKKIELGIASGDLKLKDATRITQVIVPALLGRLGQQELGHGALRATQAYLLTGLNIVLLPLAVLSSLAEPAQIGIRMTDSILGHSSTESQLKVLATMFRGLTTPEGKLERENVRILLKARGLIMSSALESVFTSSVEGEYMPTALRKLNAKFFEVTLLKKWTDHVRITSYILGKDAMMDYVTQARAGVPQAQAQCDSIGLDYSDKVGELNEAWERSENFKTAITRWMGEATLRPGADTRPARFSDPRLALVTYLKDFPWAMQARTLTYVAQQSRLQPTVMAKMVPWLGAVIPMMIAGGIGAAAKDLIANQLPSALLGIEPKDNYESMLGASYAALKKSGLLGQFELMIQSAEELEYGGVPGLSAFGPVATKLQAMAKGGVGNTAMNSLPFISMFPKHVRDALLRLLHLKAEEE